MKNITKTGEAIGILQRGGFRWLRIGTDSSRLTRRSDDLFEFRLHRGHDITQTKDTIAHQLIEAAKSQNCILAIAEAKHEMVGDPHPKRVGDFLIVVQFTLEQKDEPKGKPAAEVEGQGRRQWIGVYVDNDEDAKKVLDVLKAVKDGFIPPSGSIGIPSLDWDHFEPSSGEDEAWRDTALSPNEKEG